MQDSWRFIRDRLRFFNPALLRRKPLFLARMVKRSLLQKAKLPVDNWRGVMLALHYGCNFNCVHCYEKSFLSSGQNILSLTEKYDLIRQCQDLGVLSFDLIGGESHLYPHFNEVVRACKPSQHYITLCTNGYGFTFEKVKELYDLGIDKFNISLDSWFAKEHDAFRRQKNAHAQALQTMEICQSVGMEVSITVVVYKDFTKTKGFQKLVDFALQNRIRLACKLAIPVGNWQDDHSVLVGKDDLQTIDQLYQDTGLIVRDIHGTPDGTCPAFKNIFTVSAFGDVLPCNAVHISFGNVRTQPLADILTAGQKLFKDVSAFKGCPPAEDLGFISSYLSKTYDVSPYPAKSSDIFGGP